VAEMQRHDGKAPPKTSGRMAWRGLLHRSVRYSRYAISLAILGLLLAWIPVILPRWFDSDEFEHSHAAWCVFKGMLPYKDFFEHHTPRYYYLLSPFFHWL
jgi:hypothetical protein